MTSACFEHTLLLTRLLTPMHVKHTVPKLHNNRLFKEEPSGLKRVEDIKIKIKIPI
jgi:hypothetical protein